MPESLLPHAPLVLGLLTLSIIFLLASLVVRSRELGRTRHVLTELREDYNTQAEAAIIGAERSKQLDSLNQDYMALRGSHEALLRQHQTLDKDYTELNTRSEEQQKRYDEALKQLEKSRVVLAKDFENLANRIFDEKTSKFSELSKANINQTLSPLRDQLKEFRQRVDTVYTVEAKERAVLKEQITQLQNLNIQISEDALNLTRALKGDSKVQGNWGEIVLERILEESGLRKGHEYATQVSLTGSEGERRNPDVIVHLPDEKDIVIDSKVSLLDYERYCSSKDDADKARAIKGHVTSLKNHIEGLSVKSYEHLEGINTLDFVLIFVPIEAAFLLAFEHEPELFRIAYDKNIIVVSPTTLLATLRTIQSIWRYERQNRNAEEIANRAGLLHRQIALLLEDFLAVNKHLGRAQESWHDARERLSSGRGNLVNQAEDLERLGAKLRKKLPDAFSGDTDDIEPLPDDTDADSDNEQD